MIFSCAFLQIVTIETQTDLFFTNFFVIIVCSSLIVSARYRNCSRLLSHSSLTILTRSLSIFHCSFQWNGFDCVDWTVKVQISFKFFSIFQILFLIFRLGDNNLSQRNRLFPFAVFFSIWKMKILSMKPAVCYFNTENLDKTQQKCLVRRKEKK